MSYNTKLASEVNSDDPSSAGVRGGIRDVSKRFPSVVDRMPDESAAESARLSAKSRNPVDDEMGGAAKGPALPLSYRFMSDEDKRALVDQGLRRDEADRAMRAAEAEKREARGYAKGGHVSSASKRADGIAQRGKTKGKYL